jgi:uncharacterized protein YoxC
MKDERKKKAAARKMLKLQKFLEKAASKGTKILNKEMGTLVKEMDALVKEYEDLMDETKQILREYDEAIIKAQNDGEDVSEKVKIRDEIAVAIHELEDALAGVHQSPIV